MINYLDRYVIAAVLEPIGQELKLTDSQLGYIPFVFLIVYMFTAPLFGTLADKHSRPKLVAIGVALWSLATFAGAFVQDYTSLLITRSFVGVGEAAYAILGPAILCDLFEEKDRASKFTWFYLAIPVGSALGYGLSGFIAHHWGWRSAFLVAGIPGLLCAAKMYFEKDPPRGGKDSVIDQATNLTYLQKLKALFSNRIWLACTISYTGYTFAMGALSHWSPTLLTRKFGLTTGEAGMIFGGFAVVTGIIGTFVGGYSTKFFQSKYPNAGVFISGVSLLLAAPCIYFSLQAQNLSMVYALFFLCMLLLFVNTSPINALTVSSVPASIRATGVSVNVLLIHLLGDAISPGWVGQRSDALGGDGEALSVALHIVPVAIVFSAVALFWARKNSKALPTHLRN